MALTKKEDVGTPRIFSELVGDCAGLNAISLRAEFVFPSSRAGLGGSQRVGNPLTLRIWAI